MIRKLIIWWFTVPAAFNSDERQATKDAIEIAGFTDFHILDEPAATLLYFINNGDGSLMKSSIDLNGKNIMIYDIGGEHWISALQSWKKMRQAMSMRA